LALVQFVLRVLGYFLSKNIIRLIGWVVFGVAEVVWVFMILYISWLAVRRRKWSALNTLIVGLIFGFVGGLVLALGLALGNAVALVLTQSWGVFKAVAYSGVEVIFLPLINCVLGGFISGIIGLILEK
jgi:uncharacterized membrane protein YjgN (DUF898 family)